MIFAVSPCLINLFLVNCQKNLLPMLSMTTITPTLADVAFLKARCCVFLSKPHLNCQSANRGAHRARIAAWGADPGHSSKSVHRAYAKRALIKFHRWKITNSGRLRSSSAGINCFFHALTTRLTFSSNSSFDGGFGDGGGDVFHHLAIENTGHNVFRV